ncbi:hypothetical protein [Microlunatus speluncae]|uniref:hypothetical protein n=1 Tax=Microlunatus speluncae TaxID=2594267 RepID=UPI0012662EBC|nr:hypothetical protein [Microlunatus speluncae]
MSDVVIARQLTDRGYGHDEIARLIRGRELTRIRRGAYAWDDSGNHRTRHRRLIDATLRQSQADLVVSHLSAAALHGLPLYRDLPKVVHLSRAGRDGGYLRGGVHLHVVPLEAADRTEIDGRPVTSLARTVVDVARMLPARRAVAMADAAWAAGLTDAATEPVLHLFRGHPGIGRARRAIAFADARSESPGESESRVVLADQGLPAPTLQYEVFDRAGELVGRCDYAWEEHRTVAEFDGLIKYGRLLKPGETSSDVIVAEKLREDALRDLGWQVVRWIWADLARPAVIAGRLHRAFARAAR